MKNMGLGIKLTIQNLRMRFEKSHLGIVWFFIEPLVLIIVFYIVFTKIFRIEIPYYSMYLCIGILAWTFHAASVSDAARSLFAKKNLLINSAFDSRLIPFSSCVAHFIGFCVSFSVLLTVMVIGLKLPSSKYMFFLPLLMILQALFCYGLCLFFSIFSVLFRDVLYGVPLLLLLWFYATPIFYTAEMIPERLRWIIIYNPMALFITAYRSCLIEPQMISVSLWGLLLGYAGVSVCLGNVLFQLNKTKIIKAL